MIRRILLLALLLATFAGCRSAGSAADPVVTDPPDYDLDHPPQILDARIDVDGDAVNAIVYTAQGAGPHPTIVLLHGFPGFEKNLDLAQAARRAGWNVVFFHYRGTWGSEGTFSMVRVLEDVAAVVDAIREEPFASQHRIAAGRVALVGHSMGGFAALVSGGELDSVACVASLAGANLGALARASASVEGGALAMAASLDDWSGPVVGPGGAALVEEVMANAERFDPTTHRAQLARKVVLLVGGRLDDVTTVTMHHAPLVEALRAEGADRLRERVFAFGDHAFSGQRVALARTLVDWLEAECRPAL